MSALRDQGAKIVMTRGSLAHHGGDVVDGVKTLSDEPRVGHPSEVAVRRMDRYVPQNVGGQKEAMQKAHAESSRNMSLLLMVREQSVGRLVSA
jgi:hypothetical protein